MTGRRRRGVLSAGESIGRESMKKKTKNRIKSNLTAFAFGLALVAIISLSVGAVMAWGDDYRDCLELQRQGYTIACVPVGDLERLMGDWKQDELIATSLYSDDTDDDLLFVPIDDIRDALRKALRYLLPPEIPQFETTLAIYTFPPSPIQQLFDEAERLRLEAKSAKQKAENIKFIQDVLKRLEAME